MNRFLPLLSIYFLFSISLFAQEAYNSSDENVTGGDLTATTYSRDSTANALYIYEKGYSRFQEIGYNNLLTDYTAKIKILNEKGYEHANIQIRLHKSLQTSKKEKLSKLQASTFTLENGFKKETKLLPSQVYTEENETYDLVKFTFPNLSKGAVLVFSYEKESPFIFNFEPWWFQDEIPKIYSGYKTQIPGNFNYNIKKTGELALTTSKTEVKKRCFQPEGAQSPGDCLVSLYEIKNIPAFTEEPYLSSRFNFVSRIDYELMQITQLDGSVNKFTKTWKDVDRELKYEKGIGRQLKKTSLVKDLLPEELRQKTNDLSKAKEIYNFVKANYKWTGDYNIFREDDLKDLLKNKTGNVSSINILLHNIFEEQGYKVLPVISSTRANGLPTKLYPVLSEFNYIMLQVEVEGKKYLVDATEKNLNFGDVPFRSLNQYGRLLDFDNGSSWINIEPTGLSSIIYQDSIQVNPDGTSIGKSVHIYTGYHALRTRDMIEKLTDDQIFSSVSSPAKFTRSLTTVVSNKEEIEEALRLKYVLVNESQAINNIIYLNPFSFNFFDKNPFIQTERQYPVDFGFKDSYLYSINIQVPKNFEVAELPQQKLLRLPDNGGSLQFISQQVDENNVTVHLRITFPHSIYSSGFYPYLKTFFDSITEVQSQSLIVMREKV